VALAIGLERVCRGDQGVGDPIDRGALIGIIVVEDGIVPDVEMNVLTAFPSLHFSGEGGIRTLGAV
jgi:hypothetical protein